jgi:hypothetical protein
VYLVAVMDWYSRYVLSWQPSHNDEFAFLFGGPGGGAAGQSADDL